MPLPTCDLPDCAAIITHWHNSLGHARPCPAEAVGDPCPDMDPGAERISLSCFAPCPENLPKRPDPLDLPTVGEIHAAEVAAADAWLEDDDDWRSARRVRTEAVLDLIRARVPVWQPIEFAAIKPGMRVRAVHRGIEHTMTVQRVQDNYLWADDEGTGFLRDGTDHPSAAWSVDSRTIPEPEPEPEDPRVEVAAEALAQRRGVTWSEIGEEGRARWCDDARAAIAAIDALGGETR